MLQFLYLPYLHRHLPILYCHCVLERRVDLPIFILLKGDLVLEASVIHVEQTFLFLGLSFESIDYFRMFSLGLSLEGFVSW
jgi:hypothetical protein